MAIKFDDHSRAARPDQNETVDNSRQRYPFVSRLPRGRILVNSLGLLLVLGGLFWLTGLRAKAALIEQYPPPGQLIDIGGYRLHLNCLGQGSPTVILEAGLNDFSVQWAYVQPVVAGFTRVCAYDRAGLGWSDPSPRPRTNETMVDELYSLLTKADVPGPYVLVGHSFGGINMRLFAKQHPDRVAGLVLVDAAHEAQADRIPMLLAAAEQLPSQFRLLSRLRATGLLAMLPNQIPNRGLPEEALAQYRARLAVSNYFDTAIAETETFYTHPAAPNSTRLADLGNLPLIVLSRGQPAPLPGLTVAENEANEQTWQRLQAELAALSANSRQYIAEQSSHDIHLQQPELVIEAIRQCLKY